MYAAMRGALAGSGRLRRARIPALARTVLLAAFASLTLAAYCPSAASSATSVDLALGQVAGIAKNGQTVSVIGSGVPAELASGKGILLSIVAVVGEDVLFPGDRGNPASRYIFSRGSGPTKLNSDGTFDTTLELSSSFDPGGSDGKLVDCLAVQCEVAAWEGQTAPESEADLFARVPVSFGPGITVDSTSGLPVQGRDVAVSGVGFAPDDYPNGLKVALALVGDTTVSLKEAVDVTPDAEGEFTGAAVPVSGIFIKAGGFSSKPNDNIDCIVEKCSVVVWDAQKDAPAATDVITSRSVTFTPPKVTVTPASELKDGQAVAIAGSGFATVGNGVYISQIAEVDGEIVYPPPASKGIMRLIKVGRSDPAEAMKSDGSFVSSIVVRKKFKTSTGSEIDCGVVPCSVISWRAHTFPVEGKLYSSTPLSFAAPKPGPVAEQAEEAKKPAAKMGKKALKVGRRGATLKVAVFVCGSHACRLSKPKKALLKVSKKKFALKVTGPAKLAKGKRGVVKVKVGRKAAKALTGTRGVVRFKVAIKSAAGNKAVTIKKTLIGARKKIAKKKAGAKRH